MNRIQGNGGIPFYYWFLAGIIIGTLIGWFFSGFINALFRMALFVGVIAVIGLIVYLWRKSSNAERSSKNLDDIQEGSWRTIDPTGRK